MKSGLSAALALLVCNLVGASDSSAEPVNQATAAVEQIALPSFANLAKQLSPGVVNISVEARTALLGKDEQGGAEEPEMDGSAPQRSLGSGFIISPDGFVVTSNHVIDRAKKVVIRLLNDRHEYPARIIGQDQKTDLALLKIEPRAELNVVSLGDSDAVEVGDWALAIGNQFELGQTVTAGIISAKSRRVPTKGSGPYDAYIQTDASINPGSSGGPLFNVQGQVIGVNTAIFSPGRAQTGGPGFNIGIGFAVPINLVKQIVPQLKESGRVTRSMLGVVIQRVDSDVADALGLSEPSGALVADIVANSPAEKAGFKRRDIITSYEGKRIDDHEDLPLLVASTPSGKRVEVGILRQGSALKLSVQVTELRDEPRGKAPQKTRVELLGIAVDNISDDIVKALELPSRKGAIIDQVDTNSLAEKAGFARGDILLEIGGQEVNDAASLGPIVGALKRGRAVLVLVRRRDGTRYLPLKLE